MLLLLLALDVLCASLSLHCVSCLYDLGHFEVVCIDIPYPTCYKVDEFVFSFEQVLIDLRDY